MTSIRENLKAVLEERANVWETTGKPLADIAATRELTPDENTKWVAAEAAHRAFDTRVNLLTLSLEQERSLAEFGQALNNDDQVRAAFETELRTVLGHGGPGFLEESFTGREFRALSVGTASAGGNTVAKEFLALLLEPLRQFSPLYEAGATVITTTTGADLTIPRLASFGSAAAQAEAAQLTGTDPSFNQVTFKGFKYGDYRGVSTELVRDSAVDIEAIVARLIGENIGYEFGRKLSVGAGTTEPSGVFTAATVGITGATGAGGGFTFDNLIDLQESVLAPYHVNASWIASNTAVGAARKLKDTVGQYLWQPSTQVGVPDLLLGKPIRRDPYAAALGLGNVPLAFGDFSRYWIRNVGNLRVERSDHALFGSDQIAFRGVLFGDGQLVDANAVKTFKGGAS